jgi:DNA-binding response OmpR family regulator
MRATAKSKRTILLLDDEENELRNASQILQGEGYTVVEADSYQAALSAFEATKSLDVLIADISLPDGNGCELAATLLNLEPQLKVLFISGHVGAEVCRFYGFDISDLHYLRKPFEKEAFLSRVREVLESKEQPRLIPRTRGAQG